jgi:hypothetical protein
LAIVVPVGESPFTDACDWIRVADSTDVVPFLMFSRCTAASESTRGVLSTPSVLAVPVPAVAPIRARSAALVAPLCEPPAEPRVTGTTLTVVGPVG